ncbi:MAG: GldG family protein [Dehalococcoidales bacterium]|nr:MAG: GldG family protein [Dehalococcoidales bacterium]
MQTSPRAYGLSGLIAILGLVALLVGLVILALLPDIPYASWIIMVIGGLLLVAAFIMDFRRVGRALTARRGIFGIGTTVMASVFIGITLVINAISIGNFHRFDLTGVAQFTLTSQTQEVLSELETPVQALTFSVPGDPLGSYTFDLLKEYQNHTDQLSMKFIDADQQPDLARQYGITEYPTTAFESQNHLRLVGPNEIIIRVGENIAFEAEHPFTSAILEVTGTIQKKLYFVTGHGETNTRTDYSLAKEGLLDNLYKVNTFDITDNLTIPADAAALIMVAPRFTIIESEVEAIREYLEDGGQLLLLTNPSPPSGVNQLLQNWGIKIEEGIAIDAAAYVAPNKDIPLITGDRNTFGLPRVFFPGATAIIPEEEAEDSVQMLPLVWTSTESWLERDYQPDEEPEFDEGTDRKGPLALGILLAAAPVSDPESESSELAKLTRLVVIGDSDFASNDHFFNVNNSDLFLNAVNWLTEETEIISIHRKAMPFRRLVVNPQEKNFIDYSSIALVPFIVLVAGGIIWWRRR